MTDPRTPASVRVDQDKSKGWIAWLVGLLLLALLAAVLFFVFADDEDEEVATDDAAVTQQDEADDEDEDEEPATEPTEQPASDQSPLALTPPFTALAAEQGRQVTVAEAQVVDVPADEAFTIGTQDQELLVYITPEAREGGGSESATNVEPGSTVTAVEGTLEPVTDQFLSMIQLTGAEADAVRENGVYLAATAFELATP